jgi:hypothetical protein
MFVRHYSFDGTKRHSSPGAPGLISVIGMQCRSSHKDHGWMIDVSYPGTNLAIVSLLLHIIDGAYIGSR